MISTGYTHDPYAELRRGAPEGGSGSVDLCEQKSIGTRETVGEHEEKNIKTLKTQVTFRCLDTISSASQREKVKVKVTEKSDGSFEVWTAEVQLVRTFFMLSGSTNPQTALGFSESNRRLSQLYRLFYS